MHMRLLLLGIIALFMTGCSMQKSSDVDQSKFTDMRLNKPGQPQKPRQQTLPSVRVVEKTEDLLGAPFKDLGIVSGESCRQTLQDPPASMPIAKKRMATKAAYKNANAVLLHECQIVTGLGCYQSAICEGTALLITQ